MTDSPSDRPLQLPGFSFPASSGQTLSYESFRGKLPLALLFVGDLDGSRDLVRRYNDRLADFGAERSQLLVVAKAVARSVREFGDSNELAVAILADPSASLFRQLGLNESELPVLIVADKEGRIQDTNQADPQEVDDALEAIRSMGPVDPDGP